MQILGRVDGFDQDEGAGQSEEGGEVSRSPKRVRRGVRRDDRMQIKRPLWPLDRPNPSVGSRPSSAGSARLAEARLGSKPAVDFEHYARVSAAPLATSNQFWGMVLGQTAASL